MVSTTVLVGRFFSLPASRNRATSLCLSLLVYFCQSARLYGSLRPEVLALVAVRGILYSLISLRAKSCLG